MGWLCPRCGAENPISVQQCRACGEAAGTGFRVREMACAGAEHLLQNGRAAVDAYIISDLSGTMVKTNRFAQWCICVTAALFVVIGICTGAQLSGVDMASRRLSSAAEVVDARMADRILTSIKGIRADGETAVRRWNAACGNVEEGISSVSPPPLRLDLEAAQERVGEAFLSMGKLWINAEAAVERYSAINDDEAERMGNAGVPLLRQEMETALKRAWSRTGETANMVRMARWRASFRVDKLSQGVREVLRFGRFQEKLLEVLEALKDLVGLGH